MTRDRGAVRAPRRRPHAVTFAYDPTIVELLKASVPGFVRSWNPVRREWLILERVYATQFADTLRGLGHTVIGIDASSRCRSGDDPAHWARILFRRVGPTRAEPLFRSLTRVLHPDNAKNRDTQLQREFNAASAELTSERNSAA